jgi:hypothetical protein
MATIDSTSPAKLAGNSAQMFKRIDAALNKETAFAWKIHNTLAFMVEALPVDLSGGLPTQCMLRDLQGDMDKLATNLMELEDNLSRMAQEASHE